MPAAAAAAVLISACAAMPSAARPSPALKPNQPNHRMPAPISTSGSELGRLAAFGQSLRRPTTSRTAIAAAPAEACTTSPPAQSCVPLEASQPCGLNTQCAIGA